MSASSSSAAPSSFYRWSVVGMLWFVCFFNYADRQAIFSVFPVLKEEFGFDEVELGLIGSAFMWVYAAGAPLAGFVGDRLRRKDLILGGCLFWSAVTAMTGWCSRLWHFVTVRALEGFGETFYFPASMALVSDYHGPKTRSRAMSLHQSSVYMGTIAGSWLGAWFAEHYGWRVGFYFFGGAGVLLALMLYRFLREPVRGQAEATGVVIEPLPLREVFGVIFRTPAVPLLMAGFLGANFVATIFLTWTPTFLVEKFGFRLTSAGLSGSVFIHLASAGAVPLGGLLADHLARTVAGGRVLVQAAGLLLGSGFVFLLGTTRDVNTLLVAMTCFGFCKGLYDSNIFASLYDAIEPRARATAAGIMNTVGWGGGALGPLAVGWLAKHGRHASSIDNMSEAIAWCGAVYVGAAILLLGAYVVFARRQGELLRAAAGASADFRQHAGQELVDRGRAEQREGVSAGGDHHVRSRPGEREDAILRPMDLEDPHPPGAHAGSEHGIEGPADERRLRLGEPLEPANRPTSQERSSQTGQEAGEPAKPGRPEGSEGAEESPAPG
jgi:MFS family permease